MSSGVVAGRDEGTPQGGPLSPLLANVLLDEVDRELERRGHRFARYADDCNVDVRSQKAGERVMALLKRLYGKLRLKINESKSAVGKAFGREFLGFTLWYARTGEVKRAVSAKALGNVPAKDTTADQSYLWPQHEPGHRTAAALRAGLESLLQSGANA